MSDADLVAIYDNMVTATMCDISSTALYIYEFCITFPEELEMWRVGKFSGVVALFFFNRYVALLTNVLGTVGYATLSDQGCVSIVKVVRTIEILQYVPWAVFSGLRAFALSKRNWPLATLIFLLAFVAVPLNLIDFAYGLTGVNEPIYGCTSIVSESDQFSNQLTIACRTCLIVSDVLLIILTWWTLTRHRLGSITSSLSFSTVLLRDGTIYFIVLLILNLVHLLLTTQAVIYTVFPVSNVTTFTEPMTAILVSRFLLDLQAANRHTCKLGSEDPMHLSTTEDRGHLSFARAVESQFASHIMPGDVDRYPLSLDEEGSISSCELTEMDTEKVE